MSGKHSRNKGANEERAIVNWLQDHGISAERVPLSGAAGGRFFGDVTLPVMGVDRPCEAKLRKDGFREIYKWIEGCFALFLRADRKRRLVVLYADDFLELLKAAERGKL